MLHNEKEEDGMTAFWIMFGIFCFIICYAAYAFYKYSQVANDIFTRNKKKDEDGR